MRRVLRHHDCARCAFGIAAALSLSTIAMGASSLQFPTAFEFESAHRASALSLMSLTVGPTVAESAGHVRWDTGPNPRPSTTTLMLPEFRGASSLAALQQALRWESLLAEMHRGDRHMAEYWRTGALPESQAQFSMLAVAQEFLGQQSPRRILRVPEPEAIASLGGYARAFANASGGASGSGGSGGAGGRAGVQLPAFPGTVDGNTPIVPPDRIPSPRPPRPAPDAGSESPAAPGTPPIVIVVDLGDLSWTDPTFAANPEPVDRPDPTRPGDPFDNSGPRPAPSGAAIPSPTAAALGLAGLAALGAGPCGRRRR